MTTSGFQLAKKKMIRVLTVLKNESISFIDVLERRVDSSVADKFVMSSESVLSAVLQRAKETLLLDS